MPGRFRRRWVRFSRTPLIILLAVLLGWLPYRQFTPARTSNFERVLMPEPRRPGSDDRNLCTHVLSPPVGGDNASRGRDLRWRNASTTWTFPKHRDRAPG